jgi:hypothetical protein
VESVSGTRYRTTGWEVYGLNLLQHLQLRGLNVVALVIRLGCKRVPGGNVCAQCVEMRHGGAQICSLQ